MFITYLVQYEVIKFSDKLNKLRIANEFEKYVGGKLYDIHIKDSNILIEIDPTYIHNRIGNHWDPNGLDKNYHLDKTVIAQKEGYRCIHVFD